MGESRETRGAIQWAILPFHTAAILDMTFVLNA